MSSAELRCIFASLPATTRGKSIVLGEGKTFLYCNGHNVYMRDFECPAKCDIYSEHQAKPVVAKYSPSGFYICSGDVSGKVRVWDTVNDTHILKNESQVLASSVKDVGWSADSQTLVVGGEGQGLYTKVVSFDTGNSKGEMSCHTKAVNAVAYRPIRPFRIATASEDMQVGFFQGPPFKFNRTIKDNKKFVNCIKYSPSGNIFISGDSDGKAFVYHGETGDLIGELGGETAQNGGGKKAHAGGIYGVAFNKDSTEVLTVSGDKTAKIWNVETRELVKEFVFGDGKNLCDQQLGCLWKEDYIITVSLNGYINYLDKSTGAPSKILKGHNKAITAMALSADKTRLYTGDTEGLIFNWDVNTGLCEDIQGKGHSNKIPDMVVTDDTLITVAWDDTVRYTCVGSNQYSPGGHKLPSQPRALAVVPDTSICVIACINHIVVVEGGNIMFEQAVSYEPTSVDIHPGNQMVAVGAKCDNHIHFFQRDGTALRGVQKFDVKDDVTGVRFSPDGAYIAATTGSNKNVWLISIADGDELKAIYNVKKHNGRIETIAWSPDSQCIATGSLDASIIVWGLNPQINRQAKLVITEAHKKAVVQKLLWLSDNIIISAGNDCCVKQWNVKLN